MNTKQTEALKLALEALEKVRAMLDNKYNVLPNGEAHEDVVTAITAIREALAEQPAQQTVEEYDPDNRTISVYPSEWKSQQEAAHGITGEQK